MCGIVGCAGNLNGLDEKVFKQLLIVDSLRGEDSTGMARIRRHDGDVVVVKQLGDPFQLFQHKPFDKALLGSHRALIGHNRYATSGDVTKANAHPFEFDTLVGVHNGTLTNKWRLQDGASFRVDSEALYNHIDIHGLRKAIDVVEGAYTLVWWDKQNETINFLRNEERPLYYSYNKERDVIYWASEGWMLSVILNKNNIKHDWPSELPVNTHMRISVDKDGKTAKPVLTPMKQPASQVYLRQSQSTKYGSKPTQEKDSIAKDNGKLTLVKNSTNSYDSKFLNEKGLEMETLLRNRDRHGTEYLSCFCPSYPANIIRLYFRKDDPIQNYLNLTFKGDIATWINDEKDGGYYKVDPWKVRYTVPVDRVVAVESDDAVEEEEEKKEDTVVGECCWCSDPILASGIYNTTTCGNLVCGACSGHKDVREFVKFVKV